MSDFLTKDALLAGTELGVEFFEILRLGRVGLRERSMEEVARWDGLRKKAEGRGADAVLQLSFEIIADSLCNEDGSRMFSTPEEITAGGKAIGKLPNKVWTPLQDKFLALNGLDDEEEDGGVGNSPEIPSD